ncbi:MAG: helix-turn-helix domain-containing protein [Thermacetogeniaceae bacterium]
MRKKEKTIYVFEGANAPWFIRGQSGMEMNIGNILRETREKKGLSLADVENETKIRTKYLAALEAENFAEIPGEAYVIGFLRNYARFLGLDADQLVNRYKSQIKSCNNVEENLSPLYAESSQPSKTKVKKEILPRLLEKKKEIVIGIAIILLLIVIVAATVAGSMLPQKDAHPHSQQPIAHNTTPAHNNATTEKTKTDSPQNITIELVATDRCWVRVVTDGNEVFSGMLYPGMNKKFQAKNIIVLRLGNAGGVEVIYNGKKLPPLGQQGTVVDKVFRKPE